MADNFGLKIGVEGEREFKKALSDINQSFKLLGSEMQLVTSQFDKNDKSVSALAARNAVLNKEIEAQKDKIAILRAALDNAATSFGENDRRTQNWQIQLNRAQAELNAMERELEESTEDAEALGEELVESGKSAEDAGSRFEKLGSILKGIGAAMGAVVAAARAAAIKLGKEVVQQFGELEQNLSGSEAVFQEYANHMQKIGEDAYKNMGVSQSQYLATANKMGALFQGSGLDVQRSAELSEKAMQRAADMASVMGIDMQMALDSVAGAAKGNFTMMDNLGVSMNATSIQAYAAAKGLNFVWASATGAQKAEVAMQMFFENTEQYAGNFARESTQTVMGSLGLLQAALSSFTAGLGNAKADMTKLTSNLAEAFQAVVSNIVPVLENIVAALPPALSAILSAVGDMAPLLLETVSKLFSQVLETLLQLLPALIPAATAAVMTIVEAIIENLPLLIQAAVELIASLVKGLGEALPLLIPAAVQAIITIVQGIVESLPMLLDAALQIILGLVEGLLSALPELIAALPTIILAIVEFIIRSIPQIIAAGIKLLSSLIEALPSIIKTIVTAIPKIINSIIAALIGSIPQIVEAGIKLLVSLIQALPQIITSIVAAIPQIVTGLVNAIVGNIDKIVMAGVQLLVALVQNLPSIIAEIVKAIPQIVSSIVSAIAGLTWKLVETGGNLIKGLWRGISDAGAWLRDKIAGFFGGVVDSIKKFFGIHSPSTLFAGLGENMAQGLGIGFGGQMNQVAKDMQNAIPSDFALNTQHKPYASANASQMPGTSIQQSISIVTPKALSEKELAREFRNMSRKLAMEY